MNVVRKEPVSPANRIASSLHHRLKMRVNSRKETERPHDVHVLKQFLLIGTHHLQPRLLAG